jgi:hypothetical protein
MNYNLSFQDMTSTIISAHEKNIPSYAKGSFGGHALKKVTEHFPTLNASLNELGMRLVLMFFQTLTDTLTNTRLNGIHTPIFL